MLYIPDGIFPMPEEPFHWMIEFERMSVHCRTILPSISQMERVAPACILLGKVMFTKPLDGLGDTNSEGLDGIVCSATAEAPCRCSTMWHTVVGGTV